MVATVKETTKRDAKKQRETLFRCLDAVLAISHKKIRALRGGDRVKQGWARVLVSAVSTYGGLLKDEELELRVIALEEKLKNSRLVPKPQDNRKKRGWRR
jgi:hypothetical protein